MASFGLLLFSTDLGVVKDASAGGVDAILVDWEHRGKHRRQSGADTEINHDSYDDLRRVCEATTTPVICRINGRGDSTPEEIDAAVNCGASEILLPMVRSPRQVDEVIELADGRCGVGILIETVAAVACAAELASLPLARVYVGLNDLAIERGSASIFDAVVDGTVDRVRPQFSVPFGFGGLTVPDGGHPVPCRLLMGEMARLDCNFSFLRRSFHRDVRGRAVQDGLRDIRQGLDQAARRSDADVERDRLLLRTAVLAAYA
jgi:hypothetical protein